jgi:hypothetical protein
MECPISISHASLILRAALGDELSEPTQENKGQVRTGERGRERERERERERAPHIDRSTARHPHSLHQEHPAIDGVALARNAFCALEQPLRAGWLNGVLIVTGGDALHKQSRCLECVAA